MGTQRENVEILLVDENTGNVARRHTETLATTTQDSVAEAVTRTPTFLDIPRWEDGGAHEDGGARQAGGGTSAGRPRSARRPGGRPRSIRPTVRR